MFKIGATITNHLIRKLFVYIIAGNARSNWKEKYARNILPRKTKVMIEINVNVSEERSELIRCSNNYYLFTRTTICQDDCKISSILLANK